MIGINIANGDFYPMLEAKEGGTKRSIRTVAHDYQEIVHIALYTSATNTLTDARYLGGFLS
jgi:hypothetical protein